MKIKKKKRYLLFYILFLFMGFNELSRLMFYQYENSKKENFVDKQKNDFFFLNLFFKKILFLDFSKKKLNCLK